MNKRKLMLILIVVIVIVIAGAAAAMSYKPKAAKKIKYVEVTQRVDGQPQSGWIGSDNAADSSPTSASFLIPTNLSEGSVITKIFVCATISDNDGEHDDTDEGSDPDVTDIKVGNSTIELTTDASGTATTSQEIEPKGDEFDAAINVTVQGVTWGGGNKVYPGPFKIIWVPGLVYNDQGTAYSIQISYEYTELVPEDQVNKAPEKEADKK